MKTAYIVGTCDTKQEELSYMKERLVRAGIPAVLVDVSTRGKGAQSDVEPEVVARSHPDGVASVLALDDRGAAVEAMGQALAAWLTAREDLGGVLGLGGGGNTSIVTRAMRELPIGIPKLMVSTIASGNVAPYVGLSDICMLSPIADVAGVNRLNRPIFDNAAASMIGMLGNAAPQAAGSDLPCIGVSQFGVTTPCVEQIRHLLSGVFECAVFHATGTGGQVMEKLLDSRLLNGTLDVTTTEVADYLFGGVLPCTADRFGALARSRSPGVVSVGALDMVNFGPLETVPSKYAHRRFYRHNPQVTLMRTTPEENSRAGEWIAARLNLCTGPLRLVVPEAGVSALDAPGQQFFDPVADRALFDALERHFNRDAKRGLVFAPLHINSIDFSRLLVDQFKEIYAQ